MDLLKDVLHASRRAKDAAERLLTQEAVLAPRSAPVVEELKRLYGAVGALCARMQERPGQIVTEAWEEGVDFQRRLLLVLSMGSAGDHALWRLAEASGRQHAGIGLSVSAARAMVHARTDESRAAAWLRLALNGRVASSPGGSPLSVLEVFNVLVRFGPIEPLFSAESVWRDGRGADAVRWQLREILAEVARSGSGFSMLEDDALFAWDARGMCLPRWTPAALDGARDWALPTAAAAAAVAAAPPPQGEAGEATERDSAGALAVSLAPASAEDAAAGAAGATGAAGAADCVLQWRPILQTRDKVLGEWRILQRAAGGKEAAPRVLARAHGARGAREADEADWQAPLAEWKQQSSLVTATLLARARRPRLPAPARRTAQRPKRHRRRRRRRGDRPPFTRGGAPQLQSRGAAGGSAASRSRTPSARPRLTRRTCPRGALPWRRRVRARPLARTAKLPLRATKRRG